MCKVLSAAARTIFAAALLFAAMPGCGKVPTFKTLIGKGEKSKTEATETKTTGGTKIASNDPDPVPGKTGDPDPPAARQPAAEQVIAAFKRTQPHDVTNDMLVGFSNELSAISGGAEMVTELDLSGAKLTGTGMRALGRFTELRSLNLSGVKFPVDDLAVVAKLRKLERLNLRDTPTNNAAMVHVSGLTNLKELRFGRTPVNDAAFAHFVNLHAMEVIGFNGNGGVTGQGFSEVRKRKGFARIRKIDAGASSFGLLGFNGVYGLTTLEEFECGNSQVNDNAMRALKLCKNLRVLGVGDAEMTDFALKQLVPLKNLESLSVRNTKHPTDRGLSFLKNHKKLKHLDVAGTSVSAAGAAALRKFIPGIEIQGDF